MQDSRDYASKEFIDTSWSQLEELLDEKMPVATTVTSCSDLYRNTSVLLSFLLLMTSITTVYFAKKESAQPQTITKEIITEKVIYQNVYIDKAEIAELSKGTHAVARPNLGSNTANRVATTAKIQEVINSFSHTNQGTDITSRADTKSAIPFVSVASLLPIDNCLTTTERPMELTNEEAFTSELPEEKRSIKVDLGLLMTSTTNRDFTGMGVSSNVHLPIAKKFDLSTGLGVNYFDRDHYFVEQINRTAQEGTTSHEDRYYQNLRTFKQIYVPLSLGYTLSKSFAINSGVKLRYTYSEELAENLPQPKTSGIPVRKARPTNQSVFNNTNVGVSAGLRYNFNPHFSIMLDSEIGLSSFMNKSLFSQPSNVNYNLNVVNLKTNYTF